MVNVLKVKARMVEFGLTQEDLAKKLGVDRATLNRKINNVDGKYLSVDEVFSLMKILDIDNPIDYFFVE